MVSYHYVQYQKKLMIQSWENLVTDERTDGRTDRQKRVTSHKAVRLTSSVHHVGNQNKNKNKREPSLFFSILSLIIFQM